MSRTSTRRTFVTEPTDDSSGNYSRRVPTAVQMENTSPPCGAPANEEPAVTSVFEPKNFFLAVLPAAERALLRNLLTFQRLPQGLVLQEPEQQVEHVHFIESGMISLVAPLQDGTAIETATLGREAILGALSAFGPHRANTRTIVQIDGGAWRLPAAEFRAAAERSPILKRMALLSSELTLAQTQQTAACNALHSAEHRLCRWIVQVRDRVDEDVIRLTHEFLAQMLAVRRPTVSLIAYELQRAGLIRYQRGRITILDKAALERGACECVEVLREKTARTISDLRASF